MPTMIVIVFTDDIRYQRLPNKWSGDNLTQTMMFFNPNLMVLVLKSNQTLTTPLSDNKELFLNSDL